MKYDDYINEKLSKMSDSELQNFSERLNFSVFSAFFRGLKGSAKGIGRSERGVVRNFKSGFKRERALDRKVDEMWKGPSPFKSNTIRAKQLPNKVASKELNPNSYTYVGGAGKTTKIETPKSTKEVESTSKNTVKTNNEVAKSTESTENAVATKPNETSTMAKEYEPASLPTNTKFNSAREAVDASPRIQSLDRKIHQAVAKGDTKMAANWRKVRDREARKIELAYHKAYSGKLRNIHEWGRDHKLISAPIGVVGAVGAGVGATGVIGVNKAADALFD